MKQKRLLKRSGSAILAALLVSSTVVPVSSVDVAAYSSMGQNRDFNGHLGIVGSMTRWGEVSDVPMNDNDGDGIYEGIFHILVTDNMLIDDSIQFKVREDESWDNNWSVYEADYDRTYNSQTNCRIDNVAVGDDLTVKVTLNTNEVSPDAMNNPDSYVNENGFEYDEDGFYYWQVDYQFVDVSPDAVTAKEQLGDDLQSYYFFDNAYTQYDRVGAYWWSPSEGNGNWPGSELIHIEGTDIWALKYDPDTPAIVFNNLVSDADHSVQNPGCQSENQDVTAANAGQVFVPDPVTEYVLEDGAIRIISGNWEDFANIEFTDVVLPEDEPVPPEPEPYSDFYYTENEDGTLTLSSYNGEDSEVEIPSEKDGKMVTAIGERAFYGCYSLERVTIPSSVKVIGKEAFSQTSLSEVTLPEGLEQIGSEAFEDCRMLESITIPSTVKDIGYAAFRYCAALNTIHLSSSLEMIGDKAFAYCDILEDITIPATVTNIGMKAFDRCDSLKKIDVDSQNGTYTSVDGILYDKDKTQLITCPGGKTKADKIPDTVTTIAARAFNNCYELTSIVFPDELTTIGEWAFDNCSSLQTLSFPAKVKGLRVSTFNGCENLSSISIDRSNPNFVSVNGVLYNKAKTNLIYCPPKKSTAVTVPSTVKRIGEYAFLYCASVPSVALPDSLTSIAKYAFWGCNSLTTVELPDNLTYIGSSAFASCDGLKEINIPGNVATMGDSVFAWCDTLEKVTIGEDVTMISESAFDDCKNLKEVVIPDSVTDIGRDAFSNCSNLTSIRLPENLRFVGDGAFEYCTNLSNVAIPHGIQEIPNYCFMHCSKLTKMVIPASVGRIGDYAFSDCINLTSVTFPEGLMDVDLEAFFNCPSLKYVALPESIDSIGYYAFGYYSNESFEKELMEDFTICGYAYSAAKDYAYVNNIRFVDVRKIVNVSKIRLDLTALTLAPGEQTSVQATIQPANATDKTLTWTTDNKNVAVVSNGIITAKSTGTCTITVKSVNGVKARVTVTVEEPLENVSVVSSERVQVGDKVRVVANGAGGAGNYIYAYYYKRSTNTKWRVLGTEFGTNSSVTFTPTAAASYDVKVIVKDSSGATAVKLFTVNAVDELPLTNVSVLGRTEVSVGSAIPILGKAVGGTAPFSYAFYFKRSSNSSWKVLGTEFGTETTARLKPTVAASYDIRVVVKDSKGATSEKQFTVVVK